jgi:GNAT superfamily N-acetyltransferase
VDDPRLRAEVRIGPLEEVPIAIIVRRATLADRSAIASFIEEAFGPLAQYKARPRWTWQFVDTPFARPEGDEVPVWIALDGDRVVGQIAVQKGLLQVDGKTFEAGWAVDIMVLQSYRGAGIGHRLHHAVVKDVDILMSLTMAQASRRMADREGCVTLSKVHQLTRWVKLDAVTVRRYMLIHTASRRWVYLAAQLSCTLFQFHRLFPCVVNPLLRMRDFVKRPRLGSGATNIVEVDCFGREVDELWERTRGDYSLIFPRDTRFLNWRFVDCPELRYRRFVAKRGGRAVGYVVLRRAEPVELQQGIIADLYASRQDTQAVDELVRHSLAFFGDKVSAVDCGTSVAEFQGVLRKHGFFKTWAHRPTCVCRDSALRERVSQMKNDLFFSKGDQDWDQIHLADPMVAAE